MRYTKIGEYFDPDGHVSAASDPKREYEIYLECFGRGAEELNCRNVEECNCEHPCGFTLRDFERYIDDLKSEECPCCGQEPVYESLGGLCAKCC